MRLYTRTGDQGETGLFGGQRVPKNHPRIVACGEVDELNACLGEGIAACDEAPDVRVLLERIQGELLIAGADLAAPIEERPPRGARKVPRVSEAMAAALEAEIDRYDAETPPLRRFILPGGTPLGARLHVARAVCRRAERAFVTAAGRESLNPEILVYLNRLSDLLFALARAVNHRAGAPDTEWQPP